MDIKDCGIKMPAERSIRHSDISVGKGVTGKSAIPYETAQCSARTESPVLASPLPFSCFYAALCHHTSICTSGYSISAARYTPARCFPRARSLFPACSRPLAVFRCTLAVSRTRTPAVSRTPTPAVPARPRPPLTVFRCALAVSRAPARRFLRARSLFPTRSRPLVVSHAPARCLALPPPPRASSSASRFPSASPHLRLAGEAEPGAERDINWL
ncbi:hypothetical protein B0H13DRAFT_2348883 [Mycena leptocephala]|nr:hypothetical protein B0H13DRAFT_2348883 [Mycena leptocephala]